MTETPYGYDGIALEIGDRVVLHPCTNLWMAVVHQSGNGTIVGISLTPKDRIYFTLDKLPKRKFSCSADTLKKVD